MGRLDGKVALITGAGSGIGESTAEIFAAEGARIVAQDIDAASAEKVTSKIGESGGQGIAVAGDVSSKADAERIVKEAVERFGRVDILVNSAGVTPRYARPEWDFEQTWDWVISINLKGTYLMSWFAVNEMKKQGSGAIVNLASIIGLVGYPSGFSDGFNAYPHSKGGVVQMTRDMGVGLAKTGIRVNAICPGFLFTNLTRSLTEDAEMLAKLESAHPMGRLGQPEEVARAAVFLASDEASFITGTCLTVDGGYTAQ